MQATEYCRNAEDLAQHLRRLIHSGNLRAGTRLQTVRELSKKYGLADKTVQRALGYLAQEGLIASKARRLGYRVQALANDPIRGRPLAFLVFDTGQPEEWAWRRQIHLTAFQQEAARRNWSVLTMPTFGASADQVVEQLKFVQAFAAVLETITPELVAGVQTIGLPTVLLDRVDGIRGLDEVGIDAYEGCYNAASYLIQKGHRRVAFFGPRAWDTNSLERYAGALAGCLAGGLGRDSLVLVQADDNEFRERSADYLSSKDPARALLTPWRDNTVAVAQAARDVGLKLGRSLDLVGWCAKEQLETAYFGIFPELKKSAATMTWSINKLARISLNLIDLRRKNPNRPYIRVKDHLDLIEPE